MRPKILKNQESQQPSETDQCYTIDYGLPSVLLRISMVGKVKQNPWLNFPLGMKFSAFNVTIKNMY